MVQNISNKCFFENLFRTPPRHLSLPSLCKVLGILVLYSTGMYSLLAMHPRPVPIRYRYIRVEWFSKSRLGNVHKNICNAKNPFLNSCISCQRWKLIFFFFLNTFLYIKSIFNIESWKHLFCKLSIKIQKGNIFFSQSDGTCHFLHINHFWEWEYNVKATATVC